MVRTDLAIEAVAALTDTPELSGVKHETCTLDGVTVERVHILSEEGERAVGKARGTYVTVSGGAFAHTSGENLERLCFCTATELSRLLNGKTENGVLVVGLGNEQCTPDALGPRTARRVLVSRHMKTELSRLLDEPSLTAVSSFSPGVLGQTGMETGEIVRGVTQRITPSLVIAVDALAARDTSRLGSTVQLASVGLSPGSGVGNKRAELSQKTLGVPVLSIGVPTVVDASALGGEGNGGMIVTPREIDLLIDRAARLVGDAINRALYPSLDKDDLAALTEE